MEKNSSNNHSKERERGVGDHGLLRSGSRPSATTPSDFVLQWGNRKRLRFMKIQVKDRDSAAAPALRTTVRIDRRVVRSDYNNFKDPAPHQTPTNNSNINAYPNLRQRPSSPAHRILRYSESSIAMKGHSNGVRGRASPEAGGAQDRRGTAHNNGRITNNDNHVAASVSSETAHDSKKGGSSSGSDAIPVVWPPKFAIALTNKEKEEDFMAIKGSKLPQRPKKRAKFIQRNLNLVSPGAWLCDLTLERYEVREKKISKKRPRGLKAMSNMDSDSE